MINSLCASTALELHCSQTAFTNHPNCRRTRRRLELVDQLLLAAPSKGKQGPQQLLELARSAEHKLILIVFDLCLEVGYGSLELLLLTQQRVGGVASDRSELLLDVPLCLQQQLLGVLSTQEGRRLVQGSARVVGQRKLLEIDARLGKSVTYPFSVSLRKGSVSRVDHGPSIADPCVVPPPVVDGNEVVRLVVDDVPVILVVQVLVVVVEQQPLVLLLHEPLHRVASEELTVGLRDAPVELPVDAPGARRVKEMNLAVEYVEDGVESRGDVPPALEQVGVEVVFEGLIGDVGVAAVVHLLVHALLVAHRTSVELAHHLVLKQITALHLALCLVRLVVAEV
mmetsp:Transcript_20227/g.49117  ORF Transcript_20227/g.49117 Transcript_20227/m.49117 type:complete len:340 (+) Transcript_20227:485-1504(+)